VTRSAIRTKLRATLHTCLDRLVNSSCLGDTLRLGRLLTIDYDALTLLVPALERAGAEHVCPGWEGRSRLAAPEGDLRALDILPNTNPAYPPSFVREPEIWGALYAVEGSRLGNRIILRRVMESGSEAERRATQFLAHGQEDRTAWGDSWRGWTPYNIVLRHSSWRCSERSECSKRTSIWHIGTRDELAHSRPKLPVNRRPQANQGSLSSAFAAWQVKRQVRPEGA
jgi:heme oxygenase